MMPTGRLIGLVSTYSNTATSQNQKWLKMCVIA